MNRREEFLKKALDIHHQYTAATSAIQKMMQQNRAVGPEWDAAVARQLGVLDAWMALPGEFEDVDPE